MTRAEAAVVLAAYGYGPDEAAELLALAEADPYGAASPSAGLHVGAPFGTTITDWSVSCTVPPGKWVRSPGDMDRARRDAAEVRANCAARAARAEGKS